MVGRHLVTGHGKNMCISSELCFYCYLQHSHDANILNSYTVLLLEHLAKTCIWILTLWYFFKKKRIVSFSLLYMFWDFWSCCWEFSTELNIPKEYQHGKMEDKLYGSSELPDALFFAFDFHVLENWEGKGKHANRNKWIMHQSCQKG